VCADAWPAARTAHHAAAKRTNLRIKTFLIIGTCAGASVAKNTTVEELLRGGHLLAEAFQLELDRDGAVGFPVAPAHIAPADDAQPPAARIVFPADELLERLLLEERVAVARNDPPTVRYRPDEREIALLDHAAAVAV